MVVRCFVLGAIFLGCISSLSGVFSQPQPFILQVLELKGEVITVLSRGEERLLKMGDQVPMGSVVRTTRKSSVVLVWLPYKARVKMAPETEVQLTPARVLEVRQGQIWVGTPPPAMGERRYPLPLQGGIAQIVCAPDGFISVARRADGTVTVSVDEGSAVVSVAGKTVLVPPKQMLLLTSQGSWMGPMPLTKQEQLMWDMGGVR